MDKKTINDSNLREALRLEYANIPQLPAGLNEKNRKQMKKYISQKIQSRYG